MDVEEIDYSGLEESPTRERVFESGSDNQIREREVIEKNGKKNNHLNYSISHDAVAAPRIDLSETPKSESSMKKRS